MQNSGFIGWTEGYVQTRIYTDYAGAVRRHLVEWVQFSKKIMIFSPCQICEFSQWSDRARAGATRQSPMLNVLKTMESDNPVTVYGNMQSWCRSLQVLQLRIQISKMTLTEDLDFENSRPYFAIRKLFHLKRSFGKVKKHNLKKLKSLLSPSRQLPQAAAGLGGWRQAANDS